MKDIPVALRVTYVDDEGIPVETYVDQFKREDVSKKVVKGGTEVIVKGYVEYAG